ncbi:MAG: TIM barrel protein [Chloroflexota bacterium]|nr:TIM barrel protein [Chloroflexota bacterium]
MSNLGFHCHQVDMLEELIPGNGLKRGEFYNLPATDLPELQRLIVQHDLDWSVHAPLVQLDWYPQPPTWSFLCDVDKDNRELTMKMITLAVEQAAEFGAEYVVVHFPSPTSDADGASDDTIESIAWGSCDRLAELSLKKKVPVHIEGVGQSHLINGTFLVAVLKEYSPLRYCFDTAHSNLASLYNGLDLYELEKELLPYLGSIHLWNTRNREDYITLRHVPVHPSQNPEDGWADIARLLEALEHKKNSIPIIFESQPSYPEVLGNYDYREGVTWVKELLGISS